MDIYTIGFTHKSAAEFFETLKRAAIQRIVDVRLSNTSQLAGFSKKDDLAYFLGEICRAEYIHEPLLAPSEELFDYFKKGKGSWDVFERRFNELLAERKIEDVIDRRWFDGPTALLCSEPTAQHCHRRLVAEYLQAHWDDVHIIHL